MISNTSLWRNKQCVFNSFYVKNVSCFLEGKKLEKCVADLVVRHSHVDHGGSGGLQQHAAQLAVGVFLVAPHQGQHLLDVFQIERREVK